MYPQREGGSFGSYVGQWNNHPPNYTELYTSNVLLRPGYLMVSHCSNINVEGVLRIRSGSWAGYIYLPDRATKTPDVYPACCKSACHNWIWQGDHDTSKEILIRVSIIDKSRGKKKKKTFCRAYSSPLLLRNRRPSYFSSHHHHAQKKATSRQ